MHGRWPGEGERGGGVGGWMGYIFIFLYKSEQKGEEKKYLKRNPII